MAQTITYDDKANTLPSTNPINEVRAEDMNEIKQVVNLNSQETAQNTTDISGLQASQGDFAFKDFVIFNNNDYPASLDQFVNSGDFNNNVSIFLPTAVGNIGRQINVRKYVPGDKTITIVPNGAETINGKSSLIIKYQYTTVTLVSDNLNWMIK